MADFIVSIISYKRSDTICKKSLRFVDSVGFPRERTYVFVANKTEEKLYREKISEYSTKTGIPTTMPNIIVGRKGIKNQRNFINRYFESGTKIISMDDDVDDLEYLTKEEKPKLVSFASKSSKYDFMKHFNATFTEMEKKGIYLGGVYAVRNPFFMSHTTTTKLMFIVGPFYFYIAQGPKKTPMVTMDEKEDVERTLLYYTRDRAVLRQNFITMKTKYYKEAGGMQSENKDRKHEAMVSAEKLINRFPGLTRLDLGKKTGHPEVRLRDPNPPRVTVSPEYLSKTN
jgi:hypothetical protein